MMIPDTLKFLLLALSVIAIICAFGWLYEKAEEEREYDDPDKW